MIVATSLVNLGRSSSVGGAKRGCALIARVLTMQKIPSVINSAILVGLIERSGSPIESQRIENMKNQPADTVLPRFPLIVAAAVSFRNGYVVVSARHYDKRMREILLKMKEARSNPGDWDEIDQGFIDQFGNFYSRAAAWKIAEAREQIAYRCGGDTRDGGTLFSENLY